MSNSSLVNYTQLSPNKTSPRNHSIDTITIHCFVGQVTVERGCEVFQSKLKKASCNYVVAKDGKIGLVVDEKDRSWCSSNSANDNRAITIEVASDTASPYAVTDAALTSLIKLCADICKRNGIKELKWKGDKSLIGKVDQQNMTVHRWFANKSCPGDYLYNKHSYIASEVNKLLSGTKTETVKPTTEVKKDTTKVDYAKSKNTQYSGTYKTTTDLRLRTGAGTSKDIILTMPKDTAVYCYGYYTNDGSTPWLYVKTTIKGTEYVGFCSKNYLIKI